MILLHFATKLPNAVILCEGELITLYRFFPGARVSRNLWKPRQLRNCKAGREGGRETTEAAGFQGNRPPEWLAEQPATQDLTRAHWQAAALMSGATHSIRGLFSSRGLLGDMWPHRRLSFSQIRKFRKGTVSSKVFLSS